MTDLRLPENELERGQGKLLEVYRPVWTPAGEPLLFETYTRYETVITRTGQLWRGREQLREEIRRIQLELGVTTVFVTHDQEEALSMADWPFDLRHCRRTRDVSRRCLA